MRRKIDDVTVDDLVANLEFYGDQTQRVVEERIAQPIPGQVVHLRIDDLERDPAQPRKSFPAERLRELAESIREDGLLNPITVRAGKNRKFMIVAGERRFRAAREAGMETVPCIVRTVTDQQAAIIALAENIHRDDLSDIEKCDALRALKELTGKTWEELAGMVHLSLDRVKGLARLDALAESVKEQVRAGVLSGHKARFLLPLPPGEQVNLANEAAVRNWSADELQQRVRQERGRRKPTARKSDLPNRSVARNTSVEGNTIGSAEAPVAAPFLPPTPQVIAEAQEAVGAAVRLMQSSGGAHIMDARVRDAFLAEVEALRELLLGS